MMPIANFDNRELPLELTPFIRQPLENVKKGLSEAGYNKKFVKSVVTGLKKTYAPAKIPSYRKQGLS